MGGGSAVRPRLSLVRQPQPEHVHADRHRHRRGLRLQRVGHLRPGALPGGVSRSRRARAGVLRIGGGDHRAGSSWPGARASRPRPNRRRDPRAAGARAEDRAAHRARWHGTRSPDRADPTGRAATRAPGRKDSRRRHRRGRRERRRRIDAHRRAHPCREDAGRCRNGGDTQRQRQLRHARRASGDRYGAGSDRPSGERCAAQPRPRPASRRQGLGLLRSGGGDRCGDQRSLVGDRRPRAAIRSRAGERGRRADHRLPVRARIGHTDVDHGGDRSRGASRRVDTVRRSPRAHGVRRYARRRQDGDADRGEAANDGSARRARLRRGRSAGAGGEPRAGQRASAGCGGTRGRDGARRRAA